MAKRWRCVVCGYVHQGERPPEACPVCGVGPEKFELMEETGSAVPVSKTDNGLLREMIESFMPHAVAAHFPNALLPTLFFFLGVGLLFDVKTLDSGIYLLLGLILPSAAVTLGTGIYSWRKHYNGTMSLIFHRKLTLGICLLLICAEMLLLRYRNPELLTSPGGVTWFFLVLAVAAIVCVALLGHYGGMLVFGRIEQIRGRWD